MKNFLIIFVIAGLLMTGSVALAANPTSVGMALDGIADLIVTGQNAVIDTDGATLSGFVLESVGGHFMPGLPPTFDQSSPGLPLSGFAVSTNVKASSQFFSAALWPGGITGIINLGQLYATLPGNIGNDLEFNYTPQAGGTIDGNWYEGGAEPDPATIGLSGAVNDTVIRSGTGNLGMTVENTAAGGSADLDYSLGVSAGGTITPGTPSPTGAVLGPGATQGHTVTAATTNSTPLGPNNVTFTVTDPLATNDGANDDAILTVLGHSTGTFVSGGITKTIDFGNVLPGAPMILGFGINNAAGANFAGLNLVSVVETLDTENQFSTDLVPSAITNQAAGVDSFFDITFERSSFGSFSGTYLFAMSDVVGMSGSAAGATLTLDVEGNVVPEPSSIVLMVMGVAGLWVIRRRRAA